MDMGQTAWGCCSLCWRQDFCPRCFPPIVYKQTGDIPVLGCQAGTGGGVDSWPRPVGMSPQGSHPSRLTRGAQSGGWR